MNELSANADRPGPVFLAGQDRSGIGLVGELLDAHPEVAISRRTNFFSFYADRYGNLADGENLQRCIADMTSYYRIRRLETDVDRLVADFAEGERTYARLFELLQVQHMERLGKHRWGDKSLGSERHADKILPAYPNGVMIHVIRDPRDCHASRSTHRSAVRGGVGTGSWDWLESARHARRNAQRFRERYRVIRYEDLVADHEAVLTSLCNFIGVTYSTDMLTTAEGPRRFHVRSVGRYAADLTTGEIRFMEAVAGRQMRRWGYERSSPPWEQDELARFVTRELPRAAAGFAFRAPRTVLEERLGRRPSTDRLVHD